MATTTSLSDGSWVAKWTWFTNDSEVVLRGYGKTKEEALKELEKASDELYNTLGKEKYI